MRDTRARLMFSSEAREFLRSGDPPSVRTRPFDTVQNSVDGSAPPPFRRTGLYSTTIARTRKGDGVTPRAPSPLSASPGLGHAVTIPGARVRETVISSGMMHDEVAVADQVIARRPSTKQFDEHHTRRNREARALQNRNAVSFP
jgi:hypothetical protein